LTFSFSLPSFIYIENYTTKKAVAQNSASAFLPLQNRFKRVSKTLQKAFFISRVVTNSVFSVFFASFLDVVFPLSLLTRGLRVLLFLNEFIRKISL